MQNKSSEALSRSAIVITRKPAYNEWMLSHWPDHPIEDRNYVYLVENEFEENSLNILTKHWETILQHEFECMTSDQSCWPDIASLHDFSIYFACAFVPIVVDLLGDRLRFNELDMHAVAAIAKDNASQN